MITIDTDGIDRDSICGAVIMESPPGSGNSNNPGNVFLGFIDQIRGELLQPGISLDIWRVLK